MGVFGVWHMYSMGFFCESLLGAFLQGSRFMGSCPREGSHVCINKRGNRFGAAWMYNIPGYSELWQHQLHLLTTLELASSESLSWERLKIYLSLSSLDTSAILVV